jgi:predicted nucleic-acid-binding protein
LRPIKVPSVLGVLDQKLAWTRPHRALCSDDALTMLGIDTNVVIRLVVADDAEQTRRARRPVDQALSREEPALEEALFRWKDSACEFSDCLIVAHNRQVGCRATATFDDKTARLPGTESV